MNDFYPVVTHFGATTLLVPFSLLVAGWLALYVGRRECVLWCACVVGVGFVVAGCKVGFETCHARWGDIKSPSGHAAFAAIAYGGFTVIAMGRSLSARAIAFRIGILLWIALIGVSRVKLRAHSVGEVWFGLAVGLAGVALFASMYRSEQRPPYLLAGGLLALVGVAAMFPIVQTFVLEPYLIDVAKLLRPYAKPLCVSLS